MMEAFYGWFGLPNGQGAKASALITTLVALRAHAIAKDWPLPGIEAELHERGLDV